MVDTGRARPGPFKPTDPMFFVELAKMTAGLAITLGLIGLCVVAMRRYGPETIRRMQASGVQRRMSVVETLVLDPARRLVLIRVDGRERLILLGEGRFLTTDEGGVR